MRENYGIASFRSRQQLLLFEDALRREGMRVQVVSTPREVAMGCGLSLRFAIEDAQAIRRAVGRHQPGNLIGLFRVSGGGPSRPEISPLK